MNVTIHSLFLVIGTVFEVAKCQSNSLHWMMSPFVTTDYVPCIIIVVTTCTMSPYVTIIKMISPWTSFSFLFMVSFVDLLLNYFVCFFYDICFHCTCILFFFFFLTCWLSGLWRQSLFKYIIVYVLIAWFSPIISIVAVLMDTALRWIQKLK